MNPEELIHLNGINGLTGQYLVDPLTTESAAAMLRGEQQESGVAGWLKRIWSAMQRPFMGLPMDIDPTDVSQAGWGVVFGPDASPAVQDALQPLLDHRSRQVQPDRFKILDYKSDEGVKDWLRRHGVYPGSVAPTKVPYYLLLVGNPSEIPFQFQYLLDIEYAVGRLAFDTPEQYGRYAESVVEYETAGAAPNLREIIYWGARHSADRATQMSADHLIRPLFEGLKEKDGSVASPPIAHSAGYSSRCFRASDATKSNLTDLMHAKQGSQAAMLFTASHGLGWPIDYHSQRAHQGALLCQDWSGFGEVAPTQFMSAADVDDDANVHGLVAFLFACYGAGTPCYDNFLLDRNQEPTPIAEQSAVAALPQRLLSHPQGAALAVLGHVDRAWAYSIRPPGVGSQLQPFRNLIGRVLDGEPVGHSTKDFSDKYAVLSAELLSKLDETQPGLKPSDDELAWLWIERNDAQNYVLLGDPAVKLNVSALQHVT